MKKRSSFKRGQAGLLGSRDSVPPPLSDDFELTGVAASKTGGNAKKTWRNRLFRGGGAKAKHGSQATAGNDRATSESTEASNTGMDRSHTVIGDDFDPFNVAPFADSRPIEQSDAPGTQETSVFVPVSAGFVADVRPGAPVVTPTRQAKTSKKEMYIPKKRLSQQDSRSDRSQNDKRTDRPRQKPRSILKPTSPSATARESGFCLSTVNADGTRRTTAVGTDQTPSAGQTDIKSSTLTAITAAASSSADVANSIYGHCTIDSAAKILQSPSRTQPSSPQQHVLQFLNRPFGRDTLTISSPWRAHVSQAEWDSDEQIWKYRVGVSFRCEQNGDVLEYTDPSATLRSLSDFCWLEQALRYEFHGALVVPSLAIQLGIPGDLNEVMTEVDGKLLQEFLNDILNDIRGRGEWVVKRSGIDLLGSEAMEIFLYRSSHSFNIPHPMDISLAPTSVVHHQDKVNGEADSAEPTNLWTWLGADLCGSGAWQNVGDDRINVNLANSAVTTNQRQSPISHALHLPITAASCSSPAIGDARSLHIQDSLVDAATFDELVDSAASGVVRYMELILAVKEYSWNRRRRSLALLERSRTWAEHEQKVGAAWKRFAISVSNLFSYEKDMETTRIGDSIKRHTLQFPYRRLQKSVVDDCLRILAKHRMERSVLALTALEPFVSAYIADLSIVGPSTDAYMHGISQCIKAHQQTTQPSNDFPSSPASQTIPHSPSLADKLKARIDRVHKQLAGAEADNNTANTSVMTDDEHLQQQQHLHMVQDSLLKNEVVLKESLTSLCKSSKLRTARMAYRYFSVEAVQCAVLHSAAETLRTKVSIASKEVMTKLITKHHLEGKKDNATEMQLVRRMVNINNNKRFLKEDDNGTEEIEHGVEIDKGVENEEAQKAALRDKALQLCRERIGRWDPKLSMAIMEAVGVADANVRVEETTRELRQVRKFAVGLREHVEQCESALRTLRDVATEGGKQRCGEYLQRFMKEFKVLLSGAFVPLEGDTRYADGATTKRLREAGVPLDDPLGWEAMRKGTCGKLFRLYAEKRGSGTDWLIDSLEALLKDYNERVESIESFVFMECVGIQLEKHFSQARAKALAAFEKKTDITSAINIATRKKMPQLVDQLKTKLELVDPTVSHTAVKEAKDAHLESKALKTELHNLAIRRLTRSRESSTERVVSLMTLWSKEEETASAEELRILKDLVGAIERCVKPAEVKAFCGRSSTSTSAC